MIDTNASQIMDSRVVQTVRVLKENNQNNNKQTTNNDMIEKEKDESFKNDPEYKPNAKRVHEPLSQNNLQRISIDGSMSKRRNERELSEKIPDNPSDIALSDSNSKVMVVNFKGKNVGESNSNNNSNVNINNNGNYSNSNGNGMTQKNKSHFIKTLMNDSNIKKYKLMCMSLFKDDSQISKLCSDCNIMNNNNSLEFFINKNLFSNSIFLYKLEMLLSGDQVMNKNYKEKFFKREILKVLNNMYLDIKYQQKMEMLEKTFEEHFQLISKFDFTN